MTNVTSHSDQELCYLENPTKDPKDPKKTTIDPEGEKAKKLSKESGKKIVNNMKETRKKNLKVLFTMARTDMWK